MSKRERHERDTWIHGGVPAQGKFKKFEVHTSEKKTN